jgi:transposase
MAAYSMDLRERVAAACDDGTDTRLEIAERFAVSVAWVRRLLQRRRDPGSLAPKPHGGGPAPAFGAAAAARLRQAVAATPAATPAATLEELARACAVACSTSAVGRALRRLGLTRKKRRSGRRSKLGRTSRRRGRVGRRSSPSSIRPGWFSSTRAARPRP